MEKLVLSVYSGSVWKRFKNKPRRPQIEEEENFSTQKEGARFPMGSLGSCSSNGGHMNTIAVLAFSAKELSY